MQHIGFESTNDVIFAYEKALISYREARELLLGTQTKDEGVKVELRFPGNLSPEDAERLRQSWLKEQRASAL